MTETEKNNWNQVVSRIQERNLHAIGVRDEINRRHRHLAKWPIFIRDFVRGPWASLIAQCEISGDRDSLEISRQAYSTLNILIWSTHIHKVGNKRADLIRSIPVVVDRLRYGMQLIGLVEGDAYSELFFDNLRCLQIRIAAEVKLISELCADPKSEKYATLLGIASKSIKAEFHQKKIDHPMFYHEDIWISPIEMNAGLATMNADASQQADQVDLSGRIDPAKPQSNVSPIFRDTGPEPVRQSLFGSDHGRGGGEPSFFLYSDSGPRPQWRAVKLSWTNASEDKNPSLFGFHDTAGDLITMTGRQLQSLIGRKSLVYMEHLLSELI